MGPEIVNRNKDSNFYGPYAGRDLYITMLEDKEREFVVTHNADIKPVAYFTGREMELQELRQRIEAGRKSVLVSGMGGIGKTHICRKLFEEYWTKYNKNADEPFRHIGYIEYSGDMDSSLQNCLKYKQQEDPKLNKEAAWRELEYLASDGKLLLFVDNVDKPMREDSGLQRLNSIPGAVVLTSRLASFSDEFELYQIGFLDREQCKRIFEKIRFEGSGGKVKSEENQDLMYIIETLAGRHTITVEFLAHLARTKLWTVKRLRDELEQKGFRLQFRKNGELINIQVEYEKLYNLSKLTGAEQNILEAFSIFPYIPLSAETCNEWLLADAGVSDDDDILMGLYQKGWLQFDWEQESYTMHPVFTQFIYDKCKPEIENHSELIKECRRCLEIPDRRAELECQKFIPFAENILEKMDTEMSEKQLELMKTLAYLLLCVGQYQEAVTLYNKLLEINSERGEEGLSDMAKTYHCLAHAYWFQEEYGKAEELFEKCLRIYERKLDDEHESIANIYSNLAGIYVDQREYGKAEELYEKSLRICEEMLGENPQSTATIYNNLAIVYNRQGRYGKAKELYERSLRICEEMLGENHVTTALCYYNLAGMYVNQREYGKAEELYEKSLRICERLYGENHPTTVDRYNKLASVYEKQGEYEKAEELYEKSLRIRERVLGEDHPDTAYIYNNLAGVYYRQEEYEKAIIYYNKAYKIFVFKLGLNHPNTQIVHKNMRGAFAEWNPEGNFDQWLEEKMKEEE